MSRSEKSLAFVVGAASIVDLATDTPWRQGRWIGPFFQLTPATQLTSAVCAALLALLALVLLRGSSPAPSVRDEARERLVELLPAVSMVYAFVWARVFVPHALALPWNVVAVAAPLFVCASAFKRWPLRYVTAIVLVVGVMLRLVLFARFSIDEGADMLPLTRAALANLVQGASPYTYYDLPDPLPLTYLPLTWLAYLPPYLARVDLRWTNLVAEMALVAAIAWPRHPSDGNERHGGLLAWGFVFLLPSSIYFDRITTAPVAWALITWCVALLARRSRYDWVLLGATAAATPLAAVLVPFAGVDTRQAIRDLAPTA